LGLLILSNPTVRVSIGGFEQQDNGDDNDTLQFLEADTATKQTATHPDWKKAYWGIGTDLIYHRQVISAPSPATLSIGECLNN